MGRELKQVALDFDWPVNKTWQGYLNPLYAAKKCEPCDGHGYSSAARRLNELWYGYLPFRPEDRGSIPFTPDDAPIRAFAERNVSRSPEFYGAGKRAVAREARRLCALFNSRWCNHLNADDVDALLKSNRLMDFTHTWTAGIGWKPKEPAALPPTPREVNEWNLSGLGHGGQYACVKAECKRLGLSHLCEHCDGEGCHWPSPEAKAAYEAWESIEPPAGPGYQIWETVSEGSPISPVFATARDLAAHMAGKKWGADDGTPFETWIAFIEGPGWAPSMIGTSAGMVTGVEGVVQLAREP